MRADWRLPLLLSAAALLTACSIPRPFEPTHPTTVPRTAPQPPPRGAAGSNVPVTNAPPQGTELPPPGPPSRIREYTLSPASKALVAQAEAQQAGGDLAAASASVERALRIEPGNPLLWLEMSKLRQAEANYPQAESMARKALANASGDAKVQAAAWHAIADSLKTRGRNQEARDAEVRADSFSPR